MTEHTPDAQQFAPLFTVHATGLGARLVSPTVAEIHMRNAAVVTSAAVTREELSTLAETLTKLAESMDDAPAQLVTPPSAGRLVVAGS